LAEVFCDLNNWKNPYLAWIWRDEMILEKKKKKCGKDKKEWIRWQTFVRHDML